MKEKKTDYLVNIKLNYCVYLYLDALRKLPKVVDGIENSVESGNSSPIGTPSSTRKDSKLVRINII